MFSDLKINEISLYNAITQYCQNLDFEASP